MSIVLDCFGHTDRGQVRTNNEDQFLIADLTKRLRMLQTSVPELDSPEWSRGVSGYLLVVADGMGGVAGGEIASGLAVESVSWYVSRTMPWFYRYQDGREEELEAELRDAIEACQKTVADVAAGSQFRKMGTTLTLAYILWPRVYVVHAGDSRCYVRRNGHFERVTRDHTVAQRAVEKGILTPAQAEHSPLAHTLWNCIGGATEGVNPDIYKATLEAGDELLLCTDGLTRKLTDDDVRGILAKAPTAEAAARALVDAANDAGGEDNITVVVARARPSAGTDQTPHDGTAVLPKS
jgi:PPM family protein phosphatase